MEQNSATQNRGQNSILAALPAAEYQRLEQHLKKVVLRQGEVLHEANTPAKSVYFLDEGVASLELSSEDGKELQMSIVGNESLVGERAIFKEGLFIVRCVMLTNGSGQMIGPRVFREEFEQCTVLHDLTLARIEARITETSQTALCNQMHSLEQRLSRWLLTFADRANSEELKVTQSLMAGMLGVRREGISGVVAALRNAGLIKTSRASITIHDRARLEKRACECYEIIRDAVQAFGGSKPVT